MTTNSRLSSSSPNSGVLRNRKDGDGPWTLSPAPPLVTGYPFGPFAIADMAGLEIYRDGFATLPQHFGERLAAPMLIELVAAGRYGVKRGGCFVTAAGDQAPLVAYRNTAYARKNRAYIRDISPP